MCATNFLFLSCRVSRGDRVTFYQPSLILTHFTPRRFLPPVRSALRRGARHRKPARRRWRQKAPGPSGGAHRPAGGPVAPMGGACPPSGSWGSRIAARLPPMSEFHVQQGPHEFQRSLSERSSHLHVLNARPCTRRAAETHRSIQPCRRDRNHGCGKKIWRGNRRADSRNEYFEIAPVRLESSPRPPARDRFTGERYVPE